MRSGKSDTSPDVEEILVVGYRSMTPEQRLERVADLNRALRELALAGIRQRYGTDLTAEEEKLRLAALSIDRETMIRAFGWDPDLTRGDVSMGSVYANLGRRFHTGQGFGGSSNRCSTSSPTITSCSRSAGSCPTTTSRAEPAGASSWQSS